MPILLEQLFSKKATEIPFENSEIFFDAELGSKLLAFQADEETFFVSRIISVEESEAWKACEEMLSHSVKMAASMVKGFYGLELISLKLRQGIQGFEASAFTQLLLKHAGKLEPGDKEVFQYGSFLFRLSKRIPNDWGKIEFKTYVDIIRKPRGELDLFVKKKGSDIIKELAAAPSQKNLVICDLGQESLFRFGEEPQTERLAKFLTKSRDSFEKAHLKVFFEHPQEGLIDLLQQFQIA